MQRRAKKTTLANMNVNVTGCSGVELEVGELSMFGGLQEHYGFLPLCWKSKQESCHPSSMQGKARHQRSKLKLLGGCPAFRPSFLVSLAVCSEIMDTRKELRAGDFGSKMLEGSFVV